MHKFVYLIDKLYDLTDGLAERLLEHQYTIPWLNLIHKEKEAINNIQSDIRKYGGANQAELFAVASEYFLNVQICLKRNIQNYIK